MPTRRPSRYEPLRAYLAARPAGEAELTLALAEVEWIIGGPLPPRASLAKFWTNAVDVPRPPVQVHAWRRAGWRVARFDGVVRAVTFARVPPAGP